MTYDKTYISAENIFGIEPELILKKYANKICKTKPVLDIGIGQGRNSFYLARKGFSIDGIDPSQVAVEQVRSIATKEKLRIEAYRCSFSNFAPKTKAYSAILVFGLIQVLDRKSIAELIDKINQWTKTGSLVFITAFSVQDASFARYSKNWSPMEDNSFHDGKGNYRSFLKPGEIIDLFNGYKTVYHWEGLGQKHRHGKGKLEQHEMIEAIFEKI